MPAYVGPPCHQKIVETQEKIQRNEERTGSVHDANAELIKYQFQSGMGGCGGLIT